MSAHTVEILTFVTAGLVVVLYLVFMAWRVRTDRRKKAEQPSTPRRGPLASPRSEVVSPAAGAVATAPVASAEPRPTVADALRGIALPDPLVPHPDVTPRGGAADRVVFLATGPPPEVVRRGVDAALEALGYARTWVGDSAVARRDEIELRVDVVDRPATVEADGRPAYPNAPADGVIVDCWITD